MGIIEQEIDQEAHLAMRSYADVQAEILKSLDPNPVHAAAAVVVAASDPIDLTESNEVQVATLPVEQSHRFRWGQCIVCVDLCRAPASALAAALAAEMSRQPVHNNPSRIVGSLNATASSAHNSSSESNENLGMDEDSATSLSVKSIPAGTSSVSASLSVVAVGVESNQVQAASTASTGDSLVSNLTSAQVGTAVLRGDVDTPKIQVCATCDGRFLARAQTSAEPSAVGFKHHS
jgi:hypothetical protein